jgi:TonB family protein
MMAAGGPLAAQAPGAAACQLPAVHDSAEYAAVIHVKAFDSTQKVQKDLLAIGAMQIAARFQTAAAVRLTLVAQDSGAEKFKPDMPGTGHFSVNGAFAVTVPRRGTGEPVQTVQTTLDPALDSAVMVAIGEARRAGDLQPLTQGAGEDVPLRIVLNVVRSDSLNAASDIPLFRFKSPRIPIDHSARLLPPLRLPRYPRDAVFQRAEGEVVVQFVVGAQGAVVNGTILVLSATDRAFIDPVIDVLQEYRFQPASSGGCVIPILVQQPFKFNIPR